MRARSKITGLPIIGTSELILGTALIDLIDYFYFDEEGKVTDIDYAGETEVCWDTQECIRRDGQRVFVDSNYNEVLESDIEPMPDEEEEP